MSIRKLNNNYNVISENLRRIRISKHLSQADITKDLNLMGINMHKNDIGRIEANERTVKDYELYGIAKVLQVPMNELLKGIENNLEK